MVHEGTVMQLSLWKPQSFLIVINAIIEQGFKILMSWVESPRWQTYRQHTDTHLSYNFEVSCKHQKKCNSNKAISIILGWRTQGTVWLLGKVLARPWSLSLLIAWVRLFCVENTTRLRSWKLCFSTVAPAFFVATIYNLLSLVL